mmetsp:Transcript_12782/g.15425  ORF Transcript_12782/g.15425 Transcript_12782/m.15425 type:complete len:141 (-) Transcript_12782:25-447(-)
MASELTRPQNVRPGRLPPPKDRLFDPPLTELGGQQARLAGQTLAKIAPKFTHIFASPTARTLSTAHQVAAELDISEVVVVPGLCECAAAAKKLTGGVHSLNFLDPAAMRALCPQITHYQSDAPDTFEEACVWLAMRHMAV